MYITLNIRLSLSEYLETISIDFHEYLGSVVKAKKS